MGCYFSIFSSADTLYRLNLEKPNKPPALTRLTVKLVLAFLPMFVFFLCIYLRKTLGMSGRGGYDEINFHKPAILQFAADFPVFKLDDYLSATTPGYHIVLAAVARLLDPAFLSIANAALTLVLFSSLFIHCLFGLAVAHRDIPIGRGALAAIGGAAIFALSLFASPYVLASGVWLLPDNLAWLLVLEIILFSILSLDRPKFIIHAAIALVLLVLVRQIHLWAAAPIIAAAFCSYRTKSLSTVGITSPPTGFLTELCDTLITNPAKRFSSAAVAFLYTLPSLLLLAYFITLWHGLTPPTFQGQYPVDVAKPLLLRLFNAPAAPAFILALFGIFGIFYAGFWFPALLKSLKTRGVFPLLLSALLLTTLFAVIPATTESIPLGRWSGLWQFTSRFPVIADHTSTLILSLALLGAVTLCGFLTSMRASHAVVCFTAIAGFTAAQAASFQLWQRYNEPFILIMLILMTTIIVAQRDPKDTFFIPLLSLIHRLRFAGPALLALLLAALSYTTFKNAKPADFYDLAPGTDRTKAFLRGDPTIKPVPLPQPK